MYVDRAADGRTDRTTHWLVCDEAGKVLKFCLSKTAAETWIRAQESKTRCRDCAKWFLEQPGDEIGWCQNPRSKNYGFAPGPEESCEKAEPKAKSETACPSH